MALGLRKKRIRWLFWLRVLAWLAGLLWPLVAALLAFAEEPRGRIVPRSRLHGMPGVIADLEGHMPENHPYRDSDRITWAHETTHGLHSRLRQLFAPLGRRVNAVYVLRDRALALDEPAHTLQFVGENVPPSLRGEVYPQYLVQQRRYWQNEPLYVLDEWVAYANGSETAIEENLPTHGELQFMSEFVNYALVLNWCAWDKHAGPESADALRDFVQWHTDRCYGLVDAAERAGRDVSAARRWQDRLRQAQDAEDLREFCRRYYGRQWTRQRLGF